MRRDHKKIVVHDVGVWLARTKTWLYSEVTGIGPGWEAWVMANRSQNLSEFPYDKLFSIRDRYGYLRWFFEQGSYRIGVCKQCPSIKKFVKKLQPDVLHSHFGPCGWRNIKLAKSTGAKHVVSFYGYDVTLTPQKSLWRKRYKELFDKVDAVLCEGPYMASAIQKLGCPEEKIHLYHLGVDVDLIKLNEPTWQQGRPLRILMAATFTEKKGLPYGFEAIGGLLAIRPDLDIRITLVGGSSKAKGYSKEKEKIMRVISDKGLRDKVDMKGFCSYSELLRLAAVHDIFLSPSVTARNGDTEGGAPVSIIEMAAAGLIIVSTMHCDIPNVLGKTNRQLLANERDSDGLINTLNWLVENPDQWKIIAIENRRLIEDKYNIKNQGVELARIYENLLVH